MPATLSTGNDSDYNNMSIHDIIYRINNTTHSPDVREKAYDYLMVNRLEKTANKKEIQDAAELYVGDKNDVAHNIGVKACMVGEGKGYFNLRNLKFRHSVSSKVEMRTIMFGQRPAANQGKYGHGERRKAQGPPQ